MTPSCSPRRCPATDCGVCRWRGASLIYVPGRTSVPQRMLMLVDRDGRAAPLTEVRGAYTHPRFAPNGRSIAVTIDSESGSDIWMLDLQRGTRTRFTSIGSCRFPT